MSKKYKNKLEVKEIWKQIKGSSVIREINPKAFAIFILTALNFWNVCALDRPLQGIP